MLSERIQRQIDRLFDEAEQAVRNEDWATVGACARAVLAFDAENADAAAFVQAARRAGEANDTAPVSAKKERTRAIPHSTRSGRSQVRWEYREVTVPLNVRSDRAWAPSRPQRDALSAVILRALQEEGAAGWESDEPVDFDSLHRNRRIRWKDVTGGFKRAFFVDALGSFASPDVLIVSAIVRMKRATISE